MQSCVSQHSKQHLTYLNKPCFALAAFLPVVLLRLLLLVVVLVVVVMLRLLVATAAL